VVKQALQIKHDNNDFEDSYSSRQSKDNRGPPLNQSQSHPSSGSRIVSDNNKGKNSNQRGKNTYPVSEPHPKKGD
jgi:hypothetical protein